MNLKMLSGKCQPFCLSLNVLIGHLQTDARRVQHSSPVRTRHGVSFVKITSEAYFVSVIVIPYANHVMSGHAIAAPGCI